MHQEPSLLEIPGWPGLERLADVVPVLLAYVDPSCVYRYVNQTYALWFGKPREHFIGKHVAQALGAAVWEGVRPHLQKALSGQEARYKATIPYETGTRHVAVTYTPDRASSGEVRGAVVLVSDIREQWNAEDALRREHRFNATLLDTTAALIVVLDAKGRIVSLNRAFEEATQSPLSEVAGRSFFELFPPAEEIESVRKVFRDLCLARDGHRHVNYIVSRTGQRRLVEWTNNVVISESGDVDYVIGTGLDITARHELEREIIVVSENERQRLGQELHDSLGQRLAALETFVHLVKDEVRRTAPSLIEKCERLGQELRATAREARILSHGLTPVSLAPEGLVDALENLAESTSSLTNIVCTFKHENTSLVHDSTTATQLFRIAQEAVQNAVRHAKARNLEIRLGRESGLIELSIADDGTGLPAASEKNPGMGLRLMHYRAELVGAILEIASPRSGGTIVRCRVLRNHETREQT